MKKYIKSSSQLIDLWKSYSGATQSAIEYAVQYLENGYDVASAVRRGVQRANEGNYEPEYEGSEFYGEEADPDAVREYIELRYPNIQACNTVTSSTDFHTKREYVSKCVQDSPQVPIDDNEEAWSQYTRDMQEYKMWAFIDALDMEIFDENEEDEFYQLWDNISKDLAAPYA